MARKTVQVPSYLHWKIGDRIAEIRLKAGRSLTYGEYIAELVERDWAQSRDPHNSDGLGSK